MYLMGPSYLSKNIQCENGQISSRKCAKCRKSELLTSDETWKYYFKPQRPVINKCQLLIITPLTENEVAQWLANLRLVLEIPGSIPDQGGENFSLNRLSLVSFAGMTLDKWAQSVNWMSPVQGNRPLCRLKKPMVI